MTDSPLTVFLIDDDEGIRRSLQRALEKRGYAVESHASAASFLAAYDPARQGCLLLDYGMPGMNGLELQRHLNVLGATIPVIFITGHGGVPESVQAIKAGAVDFLEKPFRQAHLVERIETAFAVARERLDLHEQDRRLRARFQSLTARELEIVQRMIARPSEISSKELAARSASARARSITTAPASWKR